MAMSPNIEKHIPNHMPEATGMTTAQFMAYILFMLISLPFVYIHPYKLKNFFYVASAVNIVFEFVLLIWALATMGPERFGSTISDKSFVSGSSAGWAVAYGVTSTIGSISAGILNQNDYARFARKPRDAIMGQVFSFPFYCIVCCVIGILVTAATQNRYGQPYWNLPDLFVAMIQTGGARSRVAAFFSGVSLVISQIGKITIPKYRFAQIY
jgi:NCS1 family nucleobase:cation symporter-1